MDEQVVAPHKCGQCLASFASEEAYLEHVCSTGFKPTESMNLGEDFALIQEAALKRGEERQTDNTL